MDGLLFWLEEQRGNTLVKTRPKRLDVVNLMSSHLFIIYPFQPPWSHKSSFLHLTVKGNLQNFVLFGISVFELRPLT